MGCCFQDLFKIACSILLYSHLQYHNGTIIKTQEDFFIKICTSHFIVRVPKGYSKFYSERELETKQNCNILTPTLMAVSVVSFSFSRAAQPEAQGPTLLSFSTTSYQQLLWTQTQSGAPSPFGLVWLSLPHLVSTPTVTVWLLVLTELYNSSTPTQSPTRSLEWHIWSLSSGNNCHAVHRSLSSGASVYECTMEILACPILLANFRPHDFLS